ncbi:MAG: thymidylate synthase (FAD), partial [Deltaproteobacteria bacterium]|nr:thymidylate synthase (FAD) [Deltaproteobacteria bacterium]
RMLAIAREEAPLLFEAAGPGCVRGKCSEGRLACGEAAEVRLEIAALGKGEGG